MKTREDDLLKKTRKVLKRAKKEMDKIDYNNLLRELSKVVDSVTSEINREK